MTAPELPLVPVSLAAFALESLFYGVFFTLSLISVTLIIIRNIGGLSNSRGSRHNRRDYTFMFRPMFIGTVVIFLAVTGHWIVSVVRLFDAFAFGKGGAAGPIAYYGNLAEKTEVAKTGLMIIALVTSDLMITYRAWIIWNHNYYIVIFPFGSVIGLIVCGIGITYQFSIYVPGAAVFESVAGRWITSDGVFTATTNIYCTGAIIWKIWHTNKGMLGVKHSGVNVMEILMIFVESAAIYTAWSIIFMATYESQSNFQFFMIDTIAVVAGIAFMLINVRVGLGRSVLLQPTMNTTGRGSTMMPSAVRLRPLAVNIAQVVEREIETDGERYPDTDGEYEGVGSKSYYHQKSNGSPEAV